MPVRNLSGGFQRRLAIALSLINRPELAQRAEGDLFISLHANEARRRSVNGIETYYPDQNHERHSLRVAMRENGVI